MDDSRINRSYLESLTTGELSRLADRYGIDIPPDLERIFIIEELLDLVSGGEDEADEEGGAAAEKTSPLREKDFLEPVPLPKQYNITFIEVMIRDPLWAFVFWELKGHDKEIFEKDPDFTGYYLRVSSPDPVKDGGEHTFTVPVGAGDGAWYLGFPPGGGRYTVALCVNREGEELVLASSRPFVLPELFSFPGDDDNPLHRLSGAEEFQVFRHGDRLSRPLRRPVLQADTDE